ncbi:6-carboxytetrahydropterin synthase [Flavobacteriaceae bacterium Ap0902]|nr:6-carboxytetrahydropterin synthase [Flavobacteriaceae bacterium Ap0902]
MEVTIHRKAHFNAAHRLFQKKWSDEENLEVFGKCAYPNYHGHNYDLVVSVTGQINPETGFVMNLDDLKKIIQDEVVDYLDHKNLNVDIPEFKDKIPTAENIVVLIWNKIRNRIKEGKKLEITLYETARNFVTYKGN